MFVNIWFGMTTAASEIVKARLRWNSVLDGEYTGPVTNREFLLFSKMADQDNVQRMFKTQNIQGKDWVLWSIGFDEPSDVLQIVAAELVALEEKYPTSVQVAGAWHWDGRQVGTQWTDETQTATTGTPTYPVITNVLLNFMPDVAVGGDIITPPTYVPATELADVNLIAGQSSRRFV